MAILHVQQIRGFIEKSFQPYIDLSDCLSATVQQRQGAFLTRGLAALAVLHLTDTPSDVAAAAVTDGTGDNGIDAIYFDESERRLYLVQSKWHSDGRGSLERGDVQKFVTGFHDIVNTRLDRFNQRVRSKKAEIERAVFDAGTKLVAVLAHTGQDPLSDECKRDLDDLLKEMNDPSEIVELRVFGQASLHSIVAAGAKGAPINLEIVLTEWGQIKEPFYAVYGQVAATDVASWAEAHHPRLFAPNLRMFLGRTEVNDGMLETLKTQPESFWYFNNGITALCASIKKKPHGGTTREMGLFECADVSIVNGAQTVGSLWSARSADPEALAKARVFIRFISLEGTPSDIATAITRFTNTQNRIDRRDFVTLDSQQERIRTELQIEGIEYVFKSGHVLPTGRSGFDLTEATVALACASPDVVLAVQAKREIGKLWENIEKPPYRSLFNPTISGPALWRLVQILRVVESTLQATQAELLGRDRMFPIHGNRFIEWIVFQRLRATNQLDGDLTSDEYRRTISKTTSDSIGDVILVANKSFGTDVYLASLFKNLNKCRVIAKGVLEG